MQENERDEFMQTSLDPVTDTLSYLDVNNLISEASIDFFPTSGFEVSSDDEVPPVEERDAEALLVPPPSANGTGQRGSSRKAKAAATEDAADSTSFTIPGSKRGGHKTTDTELWRIAIGRSKNKQKLLSFVQNKKHLPEWGRSHDNALRVACKRLKVEEGEVQKLYSSFTMSSPAKDKKKRNRKRQRGQSSSSENGKLAQADASSEESDEDDGGGGGEVVTKEFFTKAIKQAVEQAVVQAAGQVTEHAAPYEQATVQATEQPADKTQTFLRLITMLHETSAAFVQIDDAGSNSEDSDSDDKSRGKDKARTKKTKHFYKKIMYEIEHGEIAAWSSTEKLALLRCFRLNTRLKQKAEGWSEKK